MGKMMIEARDKKEASDRQNLRPQVKGDTNPPTRRKVIIEYNR